MVGEMEEFLARYPELSVCRESLEAMIEMVMKTFRNGGTLFTCGNGGSPFAYLSSLNLISRGVP